MSLHGSGEASLGRRRKPQTVGAQWWRRNARGRGRGHSDAKGEISRTSVEQVNLTATEALLWEVRAINWAR